MIPLVAFALAGCLAVSSSSDQVTAADLAPAFPGMESVDAGTPLALVPAPGVARTFRIPELARLAERFHLAPPSSEICVERSVAPLDPEKALLAMRAAVPGSEISVLEWSRWRVPEGEFVFPANQLRNGPAGQWWSGYVRYGGIRRFSIWARVTVRVTAGRVVAIRDLPAGQAIPADAVAIQASEVIPGAMDWAVSTEQVVGQWPRALVHAGTAVRLNQVTKPVDVARGETVQVDAESGNAHLEFEAHAEGSGTTGDRIPVTNPMPQRRFMARVAGKGRVTVDGSAAHDKP